MGFCAIHSFNFTRISATEAILDQPKETFLHAGPDPTLVIQAISSSGLTSTTIFALGILITISPPPCNQLCPA